MEHRWGQRVNVDVAIRIAARRYSVRQARLVNLSASGAYIKVSTELRLLSRVQIALSLPHRVVHPTPMIAAYVSRKGEDGVGVEWCEYAPQCVLELLRHAMAHHHGRRGTPESGRYIPAPEIADAPKSAAEA
jgi:hypothetical protein